MRLLRALLQARQLGACSLLDDVQKDVFHRGHVVTMEESPWVSRWQRDEWSGTGHVRSVVINNARRISEQQVWVLINKMIWTDRDRRLFPIKIQVKK